MQKIVLTPENLRALGVAMIRQAMKEYFGINEPMPSKERKRAIIKELRSEWNDFLTDGLSVMVADQLKKNPKEIKQRFMNAEEELECQNTVQQQAM